MKYDFHVLSHGFYSCILHYSLILSALEQPAEGGRRIAYLYAFLAFAFQVCPKLPT
jgi:hypothetical protein